MQIPYILQLIIPTIPLLVIACTGNVPKIDVSPPYNSELLNPTKTQTTTTPNKPKISLTKTSDLELTEFISSIPSTHFVKPVHFDLFEVYHILWSFSARPGFCWVCRRRLNPAYGEQNLLKQGRLG